MAYEVDYIPVGQGERSGDAICIHYGNLIGPRSERKIIVIDGGDKEAGAKMIEHINDHYYPEGYIDLMISTHPDSDHASGLRLVLEQFVVKRLLMHQPWNHAADVKNYFLDSRWTGKGLAATVRRRMRIVKELENTALSKGTEIIEPFAGFRTEDGVLTVLGPSKDYYRLLLPNFRMTPTAKAGEGILPSLIRRAGEVIRYIVQDTLGLDLLNDPGDTTSNENNSSVITLMQLDGHRLLFTGDAGKTSLQHAIEFARSHGIDLTGLNLLDVPHHGSRRNINSQILSGMNGVCCIISASGENEKHPSKRVTNALQKSGATQVCVTRKVSVLFSHDANHRGWNGPIQMEQFHTLVEE